MELVHQLLLQLLQLHQLVELLLLGGGRRVLRRGLRLRADAVRARQRRLPLRLRRMPMLRRRVLRWVLCWPLRVRRLPLRRLSGLIGGRRGW